MHKIDPIMLMSMFMAQVDGEMVHKSFFTKIENRLKRHLKRADPMAVKGSQMRIARASLPLENRTVSVAPLTWAIYHKWPDIFKDIGMKKEWFEQFNRATGAQGVTMTSLKLISEIEESLNERN